MLQVLEKRSDLRQSVSASLVYRININGTHYRAEKLNHNPYGISFKSGIALKPGTLLYIRRENCLSDCPGKKACEGCRTVMLATVKWCREHKGVAANSYVVGAKYFLDGGGY